MAKQSLVVTSAGRDRLLEKSAGSREYLIDKLGDIGAAARDNRGEVIDNGAMVNAELDLMVAGSRFALNSCDLARLILREYPQAEGFNGVAGYGTLVKYLDGDSEESIKIVCSPDSDPTRYEDRAAYESPLARAFEGKKAGDSVVFARPRGPPAIYKITGVYPLTPADLA